MNTSIGLAYSNSRTGAAPDHHSAHHRLSAIVKRFFFCHQFKKKGRHVIRPGMNHRIYLLGFVHLVVASLETLHAACSVYDPLLTREEGVAFAAQLNPEGLSC